MATNDNNLTTTANFLSLPKFVVALVIGFVVNDPDPHDFTNLRIVPWDELMPLFLVSKKWQIHFLTSLLVVKTRRIALQPLRYVTSSLMTKINMLSKGKAFFTPEKFDQLQPFDINRLQKRGTQIGISAPGCCGTTTLALELRRDLMKLGEETVRFGWSLEQQNDEHFEPICSAERLFRDTTSFNYAHIEVNSHLLAKAISKLTPDIRARVSTCFFELYVFNKNNWDHYDYRFVSFPRIVNGTELDIYSDFVAPKRYHWLVIQPSTNFLWKFKNHK